MKVSWSFNGTYHRAVIVVNDDGNQVPYPAVFYGAERTELEKRVNTRLKELS